MLQSSMSSVSQCNMGVCAYNDQGICHTATINVGPHAECHTYLHGSSKGGFQDLKSGVGACAASNCKFNASLECQAPAIDVTCFNNFSADCSTFECK
ncbi:MAG: DUF1540 domain-containing protein [Dehalogenimonas sp.]|uniref:DUF1540 domain-containing protein n=1 Tax=Candidatus Dehalogenimonas loeffleri TaxID=3127115 RepID=A0ABZ2J2E1_9CHLR|nr:DUF1540 domain-containing protein [Dehalogenimonas sp.]